MDPEGGALTANKLSDPHLGMVTAFNADGSFTYEPPAEDPEPTFAIEELWRGGTRTDNVYTIPLMGDINHDGYPDLVMSSINNGHIAVSGLDAPRCGSLVRERGHGTERFGLPELAVRQQQPCTGRRR